ncbi:MAG TPA: VF530 family protein [Brumimicrobium sp.]|nr:VF530 family protein [Brumimicrobium sp.]
MDKENTQPEEQPNNPLHGVKLATILEVLVEEYGWEELSMMVNINCFKSNPSIKSSLKFLRKTQWARDKVEGIYLKLLRRRKSGSSQSMDSSQKTNAPKKKDFSHNKKPLSTENKVVPKPTSYGSKPSYLD